MSGVCKKEFNRQMQMIQGRLKQLENHVTAIQEVQIEHILQTLKGFAAEIFNTPPDYEGIISFMASEKMMQIASAAMGSAGSALQDFKDDLPSAESDLDWASDFSLDSVKSLVEALISGTTLPRASWDQIMFQLMSAIMTLPAYGAELVSGLIDSAESELLAAEQALKDAEGMAEIIAAQAAYLSALNYRDSIQNTADAANRIVSCKTASMMLGGDGSEEDGSI